MREAITRIVSLLVASHVSVAGARQIPLTQPSSLSANTVDDAFGSDSIGIADASFEAYIQDQMAKWHVPGFAIALIDGNKTWSNGFGYATIDEDPVTPSTLFYCGSMTKSFTAAALSLLVDNSSEYYSISWDTPISTLLPDVFVLSDEWATRHITVADALAHRTGYPRHDYSASYHNDSVSMVKAFRYLPMSREPRVKWQYNNMMYGTLGYVVEHLTNTKLGEFFRAHLWQPMGMHDTFLHPDDALASRGRLAHAYYWNNDTQNYGQIPWRDETAIAGAGMSISSVLDFSRYLRHMINETGPISAAGHAALKDAHMISEREDRLFTGPVYYGFGWQGGVFQNEPIWWHSGLVNSMMSLMAIVPGRDFGFVAMLNSEGTPVLDAVIARVLYDYFDVAPSERFDMEKDWHDTFERIDVELNSCVSRLYPSAPSSSSIAVEEFVGEYFHPGYGPVFISLLCDGWIDPLDSPASPSLSENGCRLVVRKSDVFGKQVSYHMEHVYGDYWVGWLFVDDFETYRRPRDCFRAEFRASSDGLPVSFGLDVRMEGKEIPLVWFERVNEN